MSATVEPSVELHQAERALRVACAQRRIVVVDWPARGAPPAGTVAVRPLLLAGSLRFWARPPEGSAGARWEVELLLAIADAGLTKVTPGQLRPAAGSRPAPAVARLLAPPACTPSPRPPEKVAPTLAELEAAHTALRASLAERGSEALGYYGSGRAPRSGWVRCWVSEAHGCVHVAPRTPYQDRDAFLTEVREAIAEAGLVAQPRRGRAAHAPYVPAATVQPRPQRAA